MKKTMLISGLVGVWLFIGHASAATTQDHYYAHDTVTDQYGVLAPWYTGQNGQFDWRVRIAAETLKRYPWAGPEKAPTPYPEFIYSGAWRIDDQGTITVPEIRNWENGDMVQRAAYVLACFIDYYRYTGDAAALAHINWQVEHILEYDLTPDDHPWPRFPISVPLKGIPYGQADPEGLMQLDIVGEFGLYMVRAAHITGNERWLEAARHWADLLAEKRYQQPGMCPWGRYADAGKAAWEDRATGGVVFILEFFDELIRDGYTGKNDQILEARADGVAYLNYCLENWLVHDIWGRNYWDWPCHVQVENVTEFVVRYLMEHPEEFPTWRNDARNIMTLFINRTGTSTTSLGDTFHGAWAYPESSGCCDRSLWYGPLEIVNTFAQYASLTGCEWAREMARRQLILATYDGLETGQVEDNIDGGAIVAGSWFKIAHPMALKHVLAAMAWMPDVFGASRENHIMRSTEVVRSVRYLDGKIEYETYLTDRPTIDVLRLAFKPERVQADGKALERRKDTQANGYTLETVPGGDYLVTVRHDGAAQVTVTGDDPQQVLADEAIQWTGDWQRTDQGQATDRKGAEMSCTFTGNQVRLIGDFCPDGGLADVYVDGEKQLVFIDAYTPEVMENQLLYYKNGLENKEHTLKIVLRGEKNFHSAGTKIAVNEVLYSAARGKSDFGEGGGPTGPQRWIFGYPRRTDYIDSKGHAWRPATEWIIRSGNLVDSVNSWFTQRTQIQIDGTNDPELYRYGAHGPEFFADFTVGPGVYHVRLKFAETRNLEPKLRGLHIDINGERVVSDMDIPATASGIDDPEKIMKPTPAWLTPKGIRQAVDLVFNNIEPENGLISIRFQGMPGGEAIVQAIEIGPGHGGEGAKPIALHITPKVPSDARHKGNLLKNAGFEAGAAGQFGQEGQTGGGAGWHYLFVGPSRSYIWKESDYNLHPEIGLPDFHTGRQALRTHTDGKGHTVVWQEVPVKGDTTYVASVWIQAVDLDGQGFGVDPSDSAGLIVREYDGEGNLLVDHPKQAVTEPGDYVKRKLTFTTKAETRSVRFVLDAVIQGSYHHGHVTYDDCLLVPEAELTIEQPRP